MTDEDVCDKGFIWNPGNCECECDKLCDIECLDYENCKCRKKLVDKLVEECTETNDCTLLFSKIFTINIGFSTYFVS